MALPKLNTPKYKLKLPSDGRVVNYRPFLVKEEKNPDLKLRVSVDGGGCSGFQYNFAFDDKINEDDTVMEKNGATMLVDVSSMQYLNGAEVDYVEGLEGARFVVNNPNAASTCGCGSSFSINI